MTLNADFISTLFKRMDTTPIHEIMREEEAANGYTPVLPGSVDWLPLSDWPHHIVVSTNGKIVRIIAVIALQPRSGAFTRLVNGIRSAGLVPVVVAPLPDMRNILKHWRWRARYSGDGLQFEEQWRPRKGSGP